MRKMFFTIIAGALLLAACDDSSTSANSTDIPQTPDTKVTNSYDTKETSSNSNTSISSDSKTQESNSSTTKSTEKCSNASDDLIDSRDGKIYKTVKIGDQIWMAENLNYSTGSSWTNDTLDKDGSIFGRFYYRGTSLEACPEGWHLPTKEEMRTLIETAGGIENAGKHLKATSTWNKNKDGKDGNGDDSFCFGAKAAGGSQEETKGAYDVGEYTTFWTKDVYTEPPQVDFYTGIQKVTFDEYYYLKIRNDSAWVERSSSYDGRNIRCLKGDPEPEPPLPENISAQLPDSVQKELEEAIRIERLNTQIAKLTNLSECETIESITEDEIAYCKTRFCLLHPELFECEEY